MSIIYKATNNINNKSYIGFTKRSLNRRISGHKCSAFTNQSNIAFHCALRKYGFSEFAWEIIYESWDDTYCHEIVEDLLIKEFDTLENGYNSTVGGSRGPILLGKNNGMYGKTHTNNIKEILADECRKRFANKSYEELYGKEKSDRIKLIRSDNFKKVDKSGTKNPRYKPMIYTILNENTNETFTGDQMTLRNISPLSRGALCCLLNGKIKQTKGWKVTGPVASQ